VTTAEPPAERTHVRPTVVHAAEHPFREGGLRSYFVYRDLQATEPSNGLASAQIIKATAACEEGMGVHHHVLAFQLTYVIKGWVTIDYPEAGERHTLVEGDCVVQPPRLRHELVAFSEDLEVLEVAAPAAYETNEL
jgi:quercetin dioxygenase-like cupin family protein